MPRAEVILEEKLLPRSVLRESNVGEQFPHFSGDCWPAPHPAQLSSTQPPTHRSLPTAPATAAHTVCYPRAQHWGSVLPSNQFQAQALASGKSSPLVQPTPAHGQHCTGGNFTPEKLC